MTGGPLAGIRVVDLTSVVVGPTATLFLGDYGAEVVKIESPSGDLLRSGSTPPPHPRRRRLCLDEVEIARVLVQLRRRDTGEREGVSVQISDHGTGRAVAHMREQVR
jgi:hypothetical protein